MAQGSAYLPDDHASGEPAPTTGAYEQVNMFGQPNGIPIDMSHDEPFPRASLGHFWRAVERDERRP
jgi:hypothetical protein